MRPESWLETLNCAVEGVLHAVKSQRHMRWHILATLAVLVLAPRFSVTPTEFALLCLAAGMVVVAELANTAVEAVVDLASPDYHPLARAAKDVAAGAVLVAAFAAAAVGWVVLYPKVGAQVGHLAREADRAEVVTVASALLAVLALVILLKGIAGRGRPLHGGLPSGHAAVSFAIATLLTVRTADTTVALLSGLLAVMVSHSRLLHRVHTVWEVVLGAALGVTVTLALLLTVY